jgi:hypothetical protein
LLVYPKEGHFLVVPEVDYWPVQNWYLGWPLQTLETRLNGVSDPVRRRLLI